jgi:hypothetical protein
MKPPRCERKGTLPHPATHVLTWDLMSGRVTKFFCAGHAKTAFPQPDHISKLIDWEPDLADAQSVERDGASGSSA